MFLYESLELYFMKEKTWFRIIVPVQEMVAMSLHKLGSDDGLQTCMEFIRAYYKK